MAILNILKTPDPRLKQTSKPVLEFNDDLQQLIADLEETMRAGPGSVGIAAPQVNRHQRIVIVDVSTKPKVKNHGKLILINPKITEWGGTKIGREGCMSVPEFTGNVIRAEKIKLHALNEKAETIEYDCSGYEARAIQHEVDHLNGLLFLDRLVSRRTDLFKRKMYC